MDNMESRVAAFDRAHGDSVVDGCFILFEDGALRETAAYGLLRDPSSNDWERQKAILKYWKLKLSIAEEEFQTAKEGYEAAAGLRPGFCGMVPNIPETKEEVNQTLEALQKEVHRIRIKIKKTMIRIEAATPAAIIDTRKRMDAYKAHRDHVFEDISKYKI
jgi:hypothetical protein